MGLSFLRASVAILALGLLGLAVAAIVGVLLAVGVIAYDWTRMVAG